MKSGNLNIAMLCVHSHPLGKLGTSHTGGMSVYICETALEMGGRGHRVDIFTRDDGSSERVVHLSENVRLVHVKAGEGCTVTRHFLYPHIDEFIAGLEAFRSRDDVHYDLVHSHYWISGLVGRRLQDNLYIPHVVMFHTIGVSENMFSPEPDEPELRLVCEEELVREADLIISPTEREKGEIIQYYAGDPDGISVISCGINQDLFRPMDRKKSRAAVGFFGDEKMLLYAGRIDPMKGVDRLIEAAAMLKEKLRFKLVIVGGDDSPAREQIKLRKLARKLGIDEFVVFTGSLPQQELPVYYNAADVFILPSHYESFGMAGLESLACGTPIVATDVGVYPMILNDGRAGLLAPGGGPEAIAEKTMMVLERDNAGDRQNDVRAVVDGYTWSRVVDETTSLYRRLIEEKNRWRGMASRTGALMTNGHFKEKA